MNHLTKFLPIAFGIIFLSLTTFCKAQNLEDFKKIEVTKYSFKPNKENKLMKIATPFGSSNLTNNAILDSIKDKKVTSVRLIYTKYREAESFDQIQLNKKRISNLIASNPKLFSKADIKWYAVEQTTEDSSSAKNLFHGFYILYQNKAPQRDYAISDKLLNTTALNSQNYVVRVKKDTIITGKEGTQITLHPNCFLDENKKPYKGEVKIELKEAITMESIILGNLVTMADGNALESGGMIYIYAKTKEGKALTINPNQPLEVSIANKGGKNDMKVWEAEKDGKLMNWKNPKELLNKETNKDMNNTSLTSEFDTVLNACRDSFHLAFHDLDYKKNNPIIYSLNMIHFKKDGHFDYYTLYKNGDIKVRILKKLGFESAIVIKDTTYSALPFYNRKIGLPIPSIGKKYGLGLIYYQKETLNWQSREGIDINWGVQDTSINNNRYNFNFSKIGSWANIDRLANEPNTKAVEFVASLPERESFQEIGMYLIFKDKKIFLPGFKSQINKGYGFSHGDYEVPRLPVGAKATVLCIAYKNDKPYYAMKDIVISDKQDIVMNPTLSSEDDIKKLISKSF